jgi:hypothetical protein
VLRGSIAWVRSGDGMLRATVTPHVLRVSDGAERWKGDAEVVTRGNPLGGAGALARRVVQAFGVTPDSADERTLEQVATRDTAALAAFWRGERLTRGREGELSVLEQALRLFELAYHRDARYADALGRAALTLAQSSDAGKRPALHDSARALSKVARRFDPRQAQALDASAVAALAERRLDDAQGWLDRALNSNHSDVYGLQRRAPLLAFVGDTAGAWRDVESLMDLAPRSPNPLAAASATAQSLRRFPEALVLLQRARVLAPDRLDLVLLNARLARMRGNFSSMSRSLREYRRRGGALTPAEFTMLRVGDDTMTHELASTPPARLGVVTSEDSVIYYAEKGKLLLAQHNERAARALFDSAVVPLRRLAADTTAPAAERRRFTDLLAWTDAARGDRQSALAVVNAMDPDTLTLQYPNGEVAATIACNNAEIYAFADEVEQMILQLRRCLTLPGGYTASAISAEPAIWRHAIDPRLRALLGEFHLEIRRKE